MDKRQFLQQTGATTGLTALSGCTELARAIPGCGIDERTVIAFQRHGRSGNSVDDNTSHILPFDYAGLAQMYPQIIDEIDGDGTYKRCAPVSDKVLSFVTVMRSRIIRQFDQYDGTPSDSIDFLLSSAYVKRDEQYQKIFLKHQGELVSGDTLLSGSGTSNK